MKYFDQFNSNTYAGSGNQLYFAMNENEMRTGRVFYKISAGGEYIHNRSVFRFHDDLVVCGVYRGCGQ